jgi:hypothetical protein
MTYQAITLQSGATTVTLPADMVWVDRRSRSVMTQNVETASNGAVIIEEFQQIGGYPITLVARGAGDTWVDQDTVDQLIGLADQPLSDPMTLTYNDGTVVSVRFVHGNGSPAVDAKPVVEQFPVAGDAGYSLTLRLMQASA